MDAEFRAHEAQIAELRNRQAVIVNEFEKAGVAAGAGCRSTVEYLSSRFDVSRTVASDLTFAAGPLARHRWIQGSLEAGEIGFDRAVAMLRLVDAGADRRTVEASCRLDLAGVGRLAASQRRVSRRDERSVFVDRFVSIQPTLDESSWRLTGQLPAADGQVVERALALRSDEMRLLPGGESCTRRQRQADGLVAMAMDSLDRDGSIGEASSGSSVSVLVDLDAADGSGGEHGGTLEYGPRVGPAVLDELLCTGSVQIVGLSEGHPVVTSAASRAIPVAIRRFVAHRDGGCVVAGCTSRYRLQPHHITRYADGGTHNVGNLATLCWFHHHIAIHQLGFRIDPDSPPQKRRLIRSATNTDPPPRR